MKENTSRHRNTCVHASADIQAELIPTRQSLLARLRDWRDDESWREFFQTYWRLIYAASIKAGLTPSEAEEVVQETVISVSKSIGAFKYDPARGAFKAWLLQKTRWRIAEQFRKRDLPLGAGPGNDSEMIPDPGKWIPEEQSTALDQHWDQEWEHNLFEAALERLKRRVDGRHYQAFDLYVLREWPVRKVADAVKLSSPRIYLIKHRLTHMLKQELEGLKQERGE
ncbi:MAG TPA: sigma-70 family RNA polymerase sigma factor [Methylomirabilota bacterium]|nr:sigma-70 family RNA polymerase sigma factor [Methylomirabilota bacterium]